MSDLLNPTTFLVLVIGITIALVLAVRLARDPSFGLILMVFFLPFERIPSFELGGFSLRINHLIGGLTFVFWLLALLFGGRKIAPNPLTIPLLAMFFLFLLSGLGAENQFRHWSVYVSLLLMLVFYLLTINSLVSKKIVELVVGSLFLSAGLMGLLGLYQFFGDLAGLPPAATGLDPGYTNVVFGFPRVHAFSEEPLYFANYLFIPLGASLALFFAGKSKSTPTNSSLSLSKGQTIISIVDKLKGPWLLPLLILLLVNFFLTLSRGAFIAAVPFGLIFLLFYAKQLLSPRNLIIGFLALLVSTAAVYYSLESVSPDALDRFLSHAQLEDVLVKRQGESGLGRLEKFSQAVEAWESKPLLGIGLGNFGPYIKQYPVQKPDAGWDIVNNEYLELLAETGTLGLASVLVLLIVTFARSLVAYHRANDEYLKALLVGLTAALVAIFAQYNFFSTFYIIHIWVLFGLVIGIQNLILKPAR